MIILYLLMCANIFWSIENNSEPIKREKEIIKQASIQACLFKMHSDLS